MTLIIQRVNPTVVGLRHRVRNRHQLAHSRHRMGIKDYRSHP
ncbi:MAG: hypothetical protein ACLR7Z_15585 [Bilophila wadsworthia]